MSRLLYAAAAGPLLALATSAASAAPQISSNGAPAALVESDNESGAGLALPSFQLTADVDGGSTAKLTLTSAMDNPGDGFGEDQLSVTFSAPLSKGAEEASLITQRGLPSGWSAEVTYSSILGGAVDPNVDGRVGGPLWTWSLSGSVGIEEFKFRDAITLGEREGTRTSYAASAAVGRIAGNVFVGAGAEYRRRYKAPDDRILCPAPAGGAPTECFEGAFAPPERMNEANVFGVFRTAFFLQPGNRFPVALELRGTYDINNDVVGIEAPIYLFQAGDGNLRGGIRFGWDSEEDDVRAAVFIGVPFDLGGGG